jgi:hypothetical protein
VQDVDVMCDLRMARELSFVQIQMVREMWASLLTQGACLQKTFETKNRVLGA